MRPSHHIATQAIEQAEKNQFNPDWDAMAVMVEEQQRMAKRIEELEQAEKQEPVAYKCGNAVVHIKPPVYTTPQPQREWVGLTDNEMLMIYGQQHEGEKYSLGRMVEQALKEKNT